jgi:tetratricopeptide (TPR) repeat protein
MEEVESAIAVFELNVEEYPEAPNPYDSLGDAYRAAGRLEVAKRQYERAVALAKEQGHPGLETFRTNLKEVTKQIEEKQ